MQDVKNENYNDYCELSLVANSAYTYFNMTEVKYPTTAPTLIPTASVRPMSMATPPIPFA